MPSIKKKPFARNIDLRDKVKRRPRKTTNNTARKNLNSTKIRTFGNVNISFFGVENQTDIDNYMPLRVVGYDGAV